MAADGQRESRGSDLESKLVEHDEPLFERAHYERSVGPGDLLGGLVPVAPLIPDPEPPAIQVAFTYEQLKQYRLAGQPYIIRANYDIVTWMIEDGILKKHEEDYLEWLEWVTANL